MQLNASTCYAMQIVLYLARSKRIVSSTELSENLNISQRYILQFTGKLRDGGIWLPSGRRLRAVSGKRHEARIITRIRFAT